MSKHNLNIDVQKIAQDVQNIRHFLDKLESRIKIALTDKIIEDNNNIIEGKKI